MSLQCALYMSNTAALCCMPKLMNQKPRWGWAEGSQTGPMVLHRSMWEPPFSASPSIVFFTFIRQFDNRHHPGIETWLLSCPSFTAQADVAAKVAISDLKHKFMTAAEALLHGDLHTGRVSWEPFKCMGPSRPVNSTALVKQNSLACDSWVCGSGCQRQQGGL
jgi:hypothetical protein